MMTYVGVGDGSCKLADSDDPCGRTDKHRPPADSLIGQGHDSRTFDVLVGVSGKVHNDALMRLDINFDGDDKHSGIDPHTRAL